MSDYIDRERALSYIKSRTLGFLDGYKQGFDAGTEMITTVLKIIPPADAVQVVRCKNCVHYAGAKANEKGFLICPASGMEITPEGFCSHGEQSDESNT